MSLIDSWQFSFLITSGGLPDIELSLDGINDSGEFRWVLPELYLECTRVFVRQDIHVSIQQPISFIGSYNLGSGVY